MYIIFDVFVQNILGDTVECNENFTPNCASKRLFCVNLIDIINFPGVRRKIQQDDPLILFYRFIECLF